MIQTNRKFTREEPSREAKSIYIFCEGARREFQYFEYFKEMDSRINIEIYELQEKDDLSPRGLLNIARKCIIQSKTNPKPKYTFQENDEVWIVIDFDDDKLHTRKPQISEIIQECEQNKDWYYAISNPCFELWLYYHFFYKKPEFSGCEDSKNWKNFLNKNIPGGFDSRKHPIYIKKAISNSKQNLHLKDDLPEFGSTMVYLLGDIIYSILKEKIDKVIKELKK